MPLVLALHGSQTQLSTFGGVAARVLVYATSGVMVASGNIMIKVENALMLSPVYMYMGTCVLI